MSSIASGPRGRGTGGSPVNRFEPVHIEPDPELGVPRDVRTRIFFDRSRSVLSRNDSPDISFETSLNPYRGCEHGCSYCYARPTHEYLGFSAGLDFETRLIAKPDAPELLRKALRQPSWRPQVLAMSGVTDPYQPIERQFRITRQCLEVIREHRQPVAVITKSGLITRDTDLLAELARHRAAQVMVSLTTLDTHLARAMEPRAAQPRARLRAISELTAAGIPVGVNLAPIIPGLNDHEIPALLAASAAAGAGWAAFLIVRLPHAVRQLFDDWLALHYPDRRHKVLSRLRAMRNGQLSDPRFGARMRGSGPFYEQIKDLFELARRRAKLSERGPELAIEAFVRRGSRQLSLF